MKRKINCPFICSNVISRQCFITIGMQKKGEKEMPNVQFTIFKISAIIHSHMLIKLPMWSFTLTNLMCLALFPVCLRHAFHYNNQHKHRLGLCKTQLEELPIMFLLSDNKQIYKCSGVTAKMWGKEMNDRALLSQIEHQKWIYLKNSLSFHWHSSNLRGKNL